MTLAEDRTAEIANGLTAGQRSDIIKIGAPTNPFGGLFDALSAADIQRLKNELRLVRCYIPDGCMAPITKLTPRGRAVRSYLESNPA